MRNFVGAVLALVLSACQGESGPIESQAQPMMLVAGADPVGAGLAVAITATDATDTRVAPITPISMDAPELAPPPAPAVDAPAPGEPAEIDYGQFPVDAEILAEAEAAQPSICTATAEP